MRALRAGRPLWFGLNPHRSANTYPLLAGHQEADVVIVGGGMTGSTIAAMFADAGVRVAIVEPVLSGCGSTVASTALLLREPDLGLSDLSRGYGQRRARRIWQLSSDAARDLIRMIGRLDVDCGLTAQDAVYYAARTDAVRALSAEYQSPPIATQPRRRPNDRASCSSYTVAEGMTEGGNGTHWTGVLRLWNP